MPHRPRHLWGEQEEGLFLVGSFCAPRPFSRILFLWGDPITWRRMPGRSYRGETKRARGEACQPYRKGRSNGMWRLTYNICIWVILPFFAVFSLTKKKIRKNFLERLFPAPADGTRANAVWIHAASLGEAVIAENLLAHIRHRIPNPFLVTTNTYYTRDLLKKRLGDRAEVRSLPFDLPFSINRFIGTSTFAALILVETEIWPNLIWIAARRRIPVIIVNGRVSDATVGRYRRLSFFLKKVLSSVDLVLAQSEEHAKGSFPSACRRPSSKHGKPQILQRGRSTARWTAEGSAIVFGSIKEKEFPLVASVIRGLKQRFPDLLVFMAPREMNLVETTEEELSKSHKVTRYSSSKDQARRMGMSYSSIPWAT